TVFEKADFASFRVIPPRRNLPNTQASAVRQEKQFDIKRETIDPCFLQNRSANIEAKGLEPALRVPKRQASGHAHKKIENAARLFSPPRLMNSDQASIQRTRSKCDIDLAICDRFDQLRRLFDRRGKVRVRKKPDRFSSGKQSG